MEGNDFSFEQSLSRDELKTCLALLHQDLAYTKNGVDKINLWKDKADTRYASKMTEKIVYGMVGIILFTVCGALVTGVVKAAELIEPFL